MNKPSFRHLLLWVLQIILFVMLPVILFFAGFNHIEKLKSASLYKTIEQNLENEMASFEFYTDTERFLAELFRETYKESTSETAAKKFADIRGQVDNCFDYMIWNASDSFIAGSIKPEKFAIDWDMAWTSLKRPFQFSDKNVKADDKEMANLKILFGPQLVLQSVDACMSEGNTRLLWCDSTNRRPLAWIGFRRGFSVITFVKEANIKGTRGLEFYLQHRQKHDRYFHLGFIKEQRLVEDAPLPDPADRLKKLINHRTTPGERLETEAAFYFPRVVEDDLTLFAFVRKDAGLVPGHAIPYLASFLVFMLLMPWIIVSSRAMYNGEQVKMSISRKLTLLFAYANGLPLAMLFFAGYDFIHQKELALYDDIHAQGTRYLQTLDERFESEHALQIVNIQGAISEFKKNVRRDGLTFENYRTIIDRIYKTVEHRHNMRPYLIASETDVFGTGDSIYFGDRRLVLYDKILDSPDLKREEERRVLNSLGRFIMASLNGKPPDPRSSTEVELIAESAMQKPLLEVQHDFIANDGRIDVWGIGTNKSPACMNLISINDDRQYDYICFIHWNPHVMENLYLKRQFLSANRNIIDMQIGLIYEPAGVFLPEKFPEKTQMKQNVANFTSKPCPPRQFVSVGSDTYLLMGFVGRYLFNYQIFALYPVESVKSQINMEKAGLVFAGLVSLLITIILGQFLAHSFLFPLQKLHAGAEAIRSRDFSMRLPQLGRDEFGEMADIFNTTMVDLEELKVAGVIQEHLLPRHLPDCGRFRIFGRIVSMGELGGDYFDYFNTSEGRFSLLIGDVTGRGAGAALIMAMAKAAIMQFAALLEKPDEVARHLHNLIRDTARGTQKTMIMQYLNLNAENGTGVYTNAGGWPPLIVNPHDQSVREITLPGPMLGAMKKPRFGVAELALKTDEAIIFYSDGVIEARNDADEVIGLDRLKKMVLASWCPDPEQYFDKLLAAHRQFTGKAPGRDDMTLLIAVFAEAQTPEQQPA